LTATLFQILQFIAILEVAVIYICCPHKLLFVKKLIKFKTSQLWNKLPDKLKQIRSPNYFKLQLKIIYLIKCADKNKYYSATVNYVLYYCLCLDTRLYLVGSARNVCVYLVYFCFNVCMVASVDGLKPFLATSLFGK